MSLVQEQPPSPVASEAAADPVDHLPRRLVVGGVRVSSTTYDEVAATVISAALSLRPLTVAATSAHGIVIAEHDPSFADVLDEMDVLTPDGQPVRWALNLLHGARLKDRVYGPNLMLRICQAAAEAGIGVYLYGGQPGVLERLVARLPALVPGLVVSGSCSPPFRTLSPAEDAAHVQAIRDSGAGVVFVGLGCPRQERWAWSHRSNLDLAVVCVGAAFDFHAGNLAQAPRWLQDRGLEWTFRLATEPRRLWRRYALVVPRFAFLVGRELAVKQFGS